MPPTSLWLTARGALSRNSCSAALGCPPLFHPDSVSRSLGTKGPSSQEPSSGLFLPGAWLRGGQLSLGQQTFPGRPGALWGLGQKRQLPQGGIWGILGCPSSGISIRGQGPGKLVSCNVWDSQPPHSSPHKLLRYLGVFLVGRNPTDGCLNPETNSTYKRTLTVFTVLCLCFYFTF